MCVCVYKWVGVGNSQMVVVVFVIFQVPRCQGMRKEGRFLITASVTVATVLMALSTSTRGCGCVSSSSPCSAPCCAASGVSVYRCFLSSGWWPCTNQTSNC
jgi:hypothetical protein